MTLTTTPDHNFHNAWGSIYSGDTLTDPQVRQWWREYARDPAKVERQYHAILTKYTQLFAAFFRGYQPISLHAHVSDALVPTTVASLILNTCATSPLILQNPKLAPNDSPAEDGKKIQRRILEYLGWNNLHVINPRFAVVQGLYGAGFGPLAHASTEWEVGIIASGAMPVIVALGDSPEALSQSLVEAKRHGCIAVVIDMVNTETGAVIAPHRYQMLKRVCAENKLWLIVDEALTAIRCGAPFCFQRDEYGESGPDLVAFGKGLGVSGIAINFKGPLVHGLGLITTIDRLQTIMYWRALVSRPVPLPVLLDALGILYTALMKDWPKRSLEIGETLLDIIQANSCGEQVYGLGAFLVVPKKTTLRMNIMAATRRRSPNSRWLPKLDAVYANRQVLEAHVFGPDSRASREAMSLEADENSTMPTWCFGCGMQATFHEWCRTCFLGSCDDAGCKAILKKHVCV
ncbi:hypothetical protein BJX64DRAFT_288374 [Aspergillus heterothallicus]